MFFVLLFSRASLFTLFFVLLLYFLLLTLNCQGFCVFSYLGSVCLFCVFGVFSLACFELSVPVQVIAWKDLTLK